MIGFGAKGVCVITPHHLPKLATPRQCPVLMCRLDATGGRESEGGRCLENNSGPNDKTMPTNNSAGG